ncbi:hypothetical protein [Methylopila sp. 73B]|uniref:hypothetical protein n=1 Tax=Methylopila sp. 73B TaxID=1120792 RepID=UPI0003A60E37|nr:hypothetical protein [Methylopila sp. 73B]
MADELKSERIQVLLSPSELKAIDDWGFSCRIRSRGEAIRQLVDIGLLSHKDHEVTKAALHLADVHSKILAPYLEVPGTFSNETLQELLDALDRMIGLQEKLNEDAPEIAGRIKARMDAALAEANEDGDAKP